MKFCQQYAARYVLVILASLLLLRAAASSASMFPIADMGLKLTFDVSTPSSVQYNEECFPFSSNTLFQGGTVLLTDYAAMQQTQSSEFDAGEGTIPDFFVTIRFHSSETGKPLCLQLGDYSQHQGQHQPEKSHHDGDCTTLLHTEWEWERITGPGGVSLLHTLTPKDVLDIVDTERHPSADKWDICVSTRDHVRGSDVKGVITLFQQVIAPTSESLLVDREGKEVEGGERQPFPVHQTPQPPQFPLPAEENEGLAVHKHLEVLTPKQGEAMASSTLRFNEVDAALVAVSIRAETPYDAVDIYVNTALDGAANSSLCASSINQTSVTVGDCSFRSAVAACEALLQSPSTALCSVHLPTLASCFITMQPKLGEVLVQGNAGMNGTLSILGNGCHISPNASTSTAMRFLNIDGNDLFNFHISNITLSHFGTELLDGGAIYLDNLFYTDASSFTDVKFIENVGRLGGALYIDSGCDYMALTSTIFLNNFADKGAGLYINELNNNISITNCTFQENRATYSGAGIFIDSFNHNIKLFACHFTMNSASASTSRGGGLHVNRGNDDMSLTACTFSEHTAYQGAGVHVNSGNDRFSLTFCHFNHNQALSSGGGLSVSADNVNMKITSCYFMANTADLEGGGLYVGNGNFKLIVAFCNFSKNSAAEGQGGALYVNYYIEFMSLYHCNFAENTALTGGAIYISNNNHDLTINSCNFTRNSALEAGALFLNSGNVDVTLTFCTFEQNAASGGDGGSLFVHTGNDRLHITDCSFIRNTASPNGGALTFFSQNQDVIIASCVFVENTATSFGGAVMVRTENYYMTLIACSFEGNSAHTGGGMHVERGNYQMNITLCTYTGNFASFAAEGGALFFNDANQFVLLDSCSFVNNSAYKGGAVGLFEANIYMLLTSCVFSHNDAQVGGGLFLFKENIGMTLTSCAFTGNTASSGGSGAFFDTDNDHVSLNLCSFEANTALAGDGSGLYVNNANDFMTLFSCSFTHNNAEINGGGMYVHSVNEGMLITFTNFSSNTAQVYGGGLYVNTDNNNMGFEFCIFEHNSAKLHGGGMSAGSDNWDMQLTDMLFMANVAGGDGGALFLFFDNFYMTVINSMFHQNSAGSAGGAIHSALQCDHMELNQVVFVKNTAGQYGGSIYLGESHATVLMSGVTVRESFSEIGGGIFLSRFSTDIQIFSCEIMDNKADVGGGLVSFVEGLTVLASSIHDNTAVSSHGGIFIEDAIENLALHESSISNNIADSISGGLRIGRSANVTITGCQFVENEVVAGSAGGFLLTNSEEIRIYNTSFLHNSAALLGGAILVDSSTTQLAFLDTRWEGNRAGISGGALYVTDSTGVEVNGSTFSRNIVQTGSGSAIYVRASNLFLSTNAFEGNEAFGGGSVYWEHASGMAEPAGVQNGGNTFDGTNVAGYGPHWATEAHHMRLLEDKDQYSIVNYEIFAPLVGVTLEDVYDQTVATDSSTFATVYIPPSESASCDDVAGFLSGSTTVSFINGTASFASLDPLCAPNHTLGLAVTAVLEAVSGDTFFQLDFRACVQGEYYEERICNPCEVGTYSFTDPRDVALSELTKTSVCQPCPPEAVYCYKDTLALRQGYWRSDNDSTNILECPWDAESCLGGQSSGDASCGSGYHGPLCAICEDEHHFVSSSQTCEPCNDTSSFFDPFTLTAIALVCLCVLLAAYHIKKIIREEAVISLDDFIAICLLRLNIYHQDIYAEDKTRLLQFTFTMRKRAYKSCVVYITFYQIVSTLPFILADVDFPDVYDRLISAVSVVNLAINQESIASCSSGSGYDYVTKLMVRTTYPIVLVLLAWLCCQIHLRCVLGADNKMLSIQQMHKKQDIALRYKKAVMLLTFLILPSVSVTIFQTFSCHDVGPQDETEEYMAADYSVSCASERYAFAMWWAVAMLFVYPIGIPLLYFYILYASRSKIRSRDVQKEIANLLCEDYEVDFWYWEVVDTMYRVSVTGFLVLFHSTSDTIVAGMLLSLIYLKLIQLLQPFTDPGLNRIKETSIWQIFFVFLIAHFLKTDTIDTDFLTVCLLLVFFCNFILLLGQYLVQHCVRCMRASLPRDLRSQSIAVEKDREKEKESNMTMELEECSPSSSSSSPGAAHHLGGSELNLYSRSVEDAAVTQGRPSPSTNTSASANTSVTRAGWLAG